MTQERITETTDEGGKTHTTRTIITEGSTKSGPGWGILALIAALALIGVVALTQIGGAEMAKDTAIADAANQVGDAAGQVGEAAQDAAQSVDDAVNN